MTVFAVVFQCLVILSITQDASAIRLRWGACPAPVKQMNDFDINKYVGTWHMQKLMTDFTLLTKIGKCYKQVLTIDGQTPDVVRIENSLVFDMGYYFKYVIEGFAKLVSGAMGKLEVNLHLPLFGWQRSPLQVLSTDYNNYAIAVSCMDSTIFKGLFHIQTGFVLSRAPTPDSNFTETVNKQLTELDLLPSSFLQNDQFQCE